MLAKLSLIFHTVIHLRFIQIYHQVYYKLRSRLIRAHRFANTKGYLSVRSQLNLDQMAYGYVPLSSNINLTNPNQVEFVFLNTAHSFKRAGIDWNYEEKGKLWNYNLNYFEFLFSEQLNADQGESLIRQYCDRFSEIRGGFEPYPVSLRGINWIKFFCRQELNDDNLNKALYRQYNVLMANIEYHILANHLIENGFSLLFAAYYFQNERFYRKARAILMEQLDEQILDDGAHFERSPMYHQIILFRILDCINLIQNNGWKGYEMLDKFSQKAGSMLYWLREITFSNGDIPMVKDSAFGIAPESDWLANYAEALGVFPSTKIKKLSVSGYRKLSTSTMELLLDVGNISPAYQPGHAHADETNFILYDQGTPLIVDTGVSTYEKDSKRQHQRSTMAHNCVLVNGQNSSQVWGGFRVAKRAKVDLHVDTTNEVSVSHNGYRAFGVNIMRSVSIEKDGFVIHDKVSPGRVGLDSEVLLHIHPDIEPEVTDSHILLHNVRIKTEGFHKVERESYMFASGFNQSERGVLLRLKLKSESKLLIEKC